MKLSNGTDVQTHFVNSFFIRNVTVNWSSTNALRALARPFAIAGNHGANRPRALIWDPGPLSCDEACATAASKSPSEAAFYNEQFLRVRTCPLSIIAVVSQTCRQSISSAFRPNTEVPVLDMAHLSAFPIKPMSSTKVPLLEELARAMSAKCQ